MLQDHRHCSHIHTIAAQFAPKPVPCRHCKIFKECWHMAFSSLVCATHDRWLWNHRPRNWEPFATGGMVIQGQRWLWIKNPQTSEVQGKLNGINGKLQLPLNARLGFCQVPYVEIIHKWKWLYQVLGHGQQVISSHCNESNNEYIPLMDPILLDGDRGVGVTYMHSESPTWQDVECPHNSLVPSGIMPSPGQVVVVFFNKQNSLAIVFDPPGPQHVIYGLMGTSDSVSWNQHMHQYMAFGILTKLKFTYLGP